MDQAVVLARLRLKGPAVPVLTPVNDPNVDGGVEKPVAVVGISRPSSMSGFSRPLLLSVGDRRNPNGDRGF
jgi:hypothetical protein